MRTSYLFLLFSIALSTAVFADSIWTGATDTNWTTTGNWTGGVPNSAGAVADFTTVAPPPEITVTGTQTVGTMAFGQSGTWTLAGGTVTLNNNTANSEITVNTGTVATLNSALTSTGTVNVSGGGTLQVSAAGGVNSWNVSNAVLEDTGAVASLGTGAITLNDGATFKSAGNTRRGYANNITVSGNTTIFSQGINLNGTLSGTGTITFLGGWQMDISKSNPNLHADWVIKQDFLRAFKNGAWGDGKVTIQASSQAAGLLVTYNKAVISNDIELKSDVNFLVGGAIGWTATLTGKLTGSASIVARSNQYAAIGTTNLQGDASEFTGAWYIHQTYVRNKVLDSPLTFVTNNTEAAKVNGGDSRFGQGTIHFGRGTIAAAASTDAFIHNNIAFDQDTTLASLDGKNATFSIPTGSSLTLTGQLSGQYPVTVNGGGTLLLKNSTSGLTSDWNISDTAVTVDNTGNKSNWLGSGKLTLNNVTLGTQGVGSLYLPNDIQMDGTLNLVVKRPLYLNGNLTGSGNLVWVSGGYTVGLCGDNREYTGNIQIAADYINTNNTTPNADPNKDLRLGQGNIYFDKTGLSGTAGQNIYVANDIYVMSGNTGNFWKGQFQLGGTLTVNGTLGSRPNSEPATVTSTGILQGTSTLNLPATIAAEGTLAPGYTNVVAFDGTAVADAPVGTLTFSQGLTMDAGSTIELDFASLTSFDKIRLTGDSRDLNLDGVTVDLNFLEGFSAAGMEFGDLFNFLDGANVTSAQNMVLNYDLSALADAYDGARLMLTVNNGTLAIMAVDPSYVPEPATWMLLILGLGWFGRKNRLRVRA